MLTELLYSTIEYCKESRNEHFSKFIISYHIKDNINLPKLYMYHITSQLRVRSDSLNQLPTDTQEDDELILLKCTITNGWPNSIK